MGWPRAPTIEVGAAVRLRRSVLEWMFGGSHFGWDRARVVLGPAVPPLKTRKSNDNTAERTFR